MNGVHRAPAQAAAVGVVFCNLRSSQCSEPARRQPKLRCVAYAVSVNTVVPHSRNVKQLRRWGTSTIYYCVSYICLADTLMWLLCSDWRLWSLCRLTVSLGSPHTNGHMILLCVPFAGGARLLPQICRHRWGEGRTKTSPDQTNPTGQETKCASVGELSFCS